MTPRVMVVHPGPNFSVADVYDGWTEGLTEAGALVAECDLSTYLTFFECGLRATAGAGNYTDADVLALAAKHAEAQAYELWPDLILIVSGFFLAGFTVELLRRRGHRVAMLMTESPYEDDRQAEWADAVDVVLLNDPTNLDRFREVNPATYYVPHAYRPTLHRPRARRPELAALTGYVGTGYPSRVAFLEAALDAGLDPAEVRLAGNWRTLDDDHPLAGALIHPRDECCPNDEAHDLYASLDVNLNLYRREAQRPELADGWAMGPREVELAAAGAFYLTEPRGENRDVLPMVPTFTSAADFVDQARYYAARPELRAEVTAKARDAIADRTFANHAAQLLARLDL